MTTKEFLQIAPKITKAGIFSNAKKGEHVGFLLGLKVFGSTETHYKKIWREYGTLENLIAFDSADNVNAKLKDFGVTEFIARNTKSGTMSRLYEVEKDDNK